MSFLNPVNEPVLRFKSTDASAPQINYNARVAGDVKAVLKACLVTGYGAKASAGWSIVNEVNHVAEFVSPSAAMSDYRLGIDDTSASSTTWYYQYQDARVNPSYNAPVKAFVAVDKTSGENGWQLLVTERGILFIELTQHTAVSKLSARITYLGAVKSALTSNTGKNIMFFNIGQNATTPIPYSFYSANTYTHVQLSDNSNTYLSAAGSTALEAAEYALDIGVVDLVSPIYLVSALKNMVIAELPPMLSKTVNKTADLYGISEQALGARNVLSVCAGSSTSNFIQATSRARTFLIKTDYWEY
ncbi:hypothetical protein [Psychrobacter sp. DAB_AL43B]|uniref:hypothetical protein n=1 Tax=Psychrobacter sp. DAB_AL43B TaxID=1028416 RepID=UPI0009A5AEE2|nr:hypothetical protein [Psychrobacter sp. DAB_AL43B]SLJ84500.1 hypothetical protein DABAL43B_1304 [Psychrobacter sp. DAB_AL43B]